MQESLSEELSTKDTSLTSPTPTGSLGTRFGGFGGGSSTSGSSTGTTTFTIPGEAHRHQLSGQRARGRGEWRRHRETNLRHLIQPHLKSRRCPRRIRRLPTKNKLKVGSTFTVYGKSVTVVGIYSAGSTFADTDVLMPLATVQTLASATGQVTDATVVVNNISNVSSVTKAITAKLGSKADVTSTEATVASELAPLNSVKTISTYTLFGAVIGAAIILLLSMLMIVRERRREVGVLKALGAPNRSIIESVHRRINDLHHPRVSRRIPGRHRTEQPHHVSARERLRR